MSIEIKSWRDGSVLYTTKTTNGVRAAVEEAVSESADLIEANLRYTNLPFTNLRGAYLCAAKLTGANLYGADLHGTDLHGAKLCGANLTNADLTGSDLHGADLCGAYLTVADLCGANLTDADLRGATLYGTNLRGADLYGANLYGAKLTGTIGIAPERTNDLLLLLDQVGKIRAYKLVDANLRSPLQPSGKITYEVGATVEAEADTDPYKDCGAGINLATLSWCIRHYRPGFRVLLMEFIAKDIAAIPQGDGKFRVSKARVVKEVDLEAIFEKEKALQNDQKTPSKTPTKGEA